MTTALSTLDWWLLAEVNTSAPAHLPWSSLAQLYGLTGTGQVLVWFIVNHFPLLLFNFSPGL